MNARRLTGLAIAMICGAASQAASQQRATPCTLDPQPTTRLRADSATGAVFVGGGVILRCPDRKLVLKGDSAERYADHDYLVGHAVYDEPRFHVTSDYLNYFPQTEIVKAVANVNARLPSGSTLVGPYAEYRRIAKGIRTREQMLALARPTITIIEKDSTGKPADPMTVVANTVFMDGDSLIYGGGQVVITRPQISATADSAFIDQTKETMHLIRNPKLKGTKDKPFTLTGDLIDLYSKNRKLQRVISRANAVAVNDSMTLKSDTIDLRVRNDLLDHAYAWGTKSRARVISTSQNVLADSLDVTMPGQKLELVRAIRKAFAQGKVDTTHFKPVPPDTTDWLRGDTIVAYFDTTPQKDTTKTPPIKLLVALGNASSYYHMTASDSTVKAPAVNYQNAHNITINFDHQGNQQRVATVTAAGVVNGLHIDPRPDTTTKRTNAAANAKDTKAKAPPAKTPPPKTPPVSKPPAASPAEPLPPKSP